MKLQIKQLRNLIREEIENIGYNKTMENKLAEFAKQNNLFYTTSKEEIATQCQVDSDDELLQGITSAAFTNNDHLMLIVGFTREDGQLYRFGDEERDEDSSEEIQTSFKKLQKHLQNMMSY